MMAVNNQSSDEMVPLKSNMDRHPLLGPPSVNSLSLDLSLLDLSLCGPPSLDLSLLGLSSLDPSLWGPPSTMAHRWICHCSVCLRWIRLCLNTLLKRFSYGQWASPSAPGRELKSLVAPPHVHGRGQGVGGGGGRRRGAEGDLHEFALNGALWGTFFRTIFYLSEGLDNKCPKPSRQAFRIYAHLNLDNSSLHKCPKPSGQAFRPPTPNGQCPNVGLKNCMGLP